MARDIRLTQRAVGTYSKTDYINSESARAKLERSICASQDLAEGHILTESDFALLSPGTGIPTLEKIVFLVLNLYIILPCMSKSCFLMFLRLTVMPSFTALFSDCDGVLLMVSVFIRLLESHVLFLCMTPMVFISFNLWV